MHSRNPYPVLRNCWFIHCSIDDNVAECSCHGLRSVFSIPLITKKLNSLLTKLNNSCYNRFIVPIFCVYIQCQWIRGNWYTRADGFYYTHFKEFLVVITTSPRWSSIQHNHVYRQADASDPPPPPTVENHLSSRQNSVRPQLFRLDDFWPITDWHSV